ncbi:MAG: MFS transporter [Candidatus Woesearchaeota archaeon]
MSSKRILLVQSALWAAYDGFTAAYLAAFALALGASNEVIGILGALPWLASIITQIPGSELSQHFHRKHIYIFFALFGRVFWIPILLTPFLFSSPIVFIVLFYLAVKLGETITDPAYTSLLADVVPRKTFGDFNSQRYRLIAAFGMIAIVAGGFWLKIFPKESPVGFAIMFALGAILAVFSTLVIGRIKEPEYKDHDHHAIKEFFTIDGPLRHLVKFGVAFNFAFMLASPFFTVYMLKTLEISYEYFGIAVAISTLAQVLSSHYIGGLTDKYGDKPIAVWGHIGTAIVPLVWLAVTKQSLWLIIPVQIFSGIAWAAADISRFNLLVGLADPRKRAMQIAEYNLYCAIPLIIAPILGGWITENVTIILTGIPLIFVISSIFRFLSTLLLFKITEPRAKKEYPLVYVFREAMHFHSNKGIIHGIQVVKRLANGLVK